MYVFYPADFVEIDDNFEVSPKDCHTYIGGSCEFSCSINSYPPANITWLFNGYPVSYGKTLTINPSMSRLLIDPINYEYLGEYRCNAVNPKSKEIRISNLAVLNGTGMSTFIITVSIVVIKHVNHLLSDYRSSRLHRECKAHQSPDWNISTSQL